MHREKKPLRDIMEMTDSVVAKEFFLNLKFLTDQEKEFFLNKRVFVNSDLGDENLITTKYEQAEFSGTGFSIELHEQKMALFALLFDKEEENPGIDFSEEYRKILELDTIVFQKKIYIPR